eukprot:comp10010_c0_seq1/m.11825 comp10010_c0_seq1/g.11825  ORF comp10010_c0_seq1/g.11825 comp10010_c0_seq1/m.11825 type:complete len:549 (+) comp10010_c0_seq1:94-1740(+)
MRASLVVVLIALLSASLVLSAPAKKAKKSGIVARNGGSPHEVADVHERSTLRRIRSHEDADASTIVVREKSTKVTRSITTGGDPNKVDATATTAAATAATKEENVVVPTKHGVVIPGLKCRAATLPAIAADLQCGDIISIRVQTNHVSVDEHGVVSVAPGACADGDLFKLHCESRTDGHVVEFGERVFFKHTATNRLLEDGGDVRAEYDHNTILVSTPLKLSPAGAAVVRHNIFTIFNPSGINARGPVGHSEIVFRNRFARYLRADVPKTGPSTVVSDIFDLEHAPDSGLFKLVSEVGPDSGCQDGSREGFVDRNKSPNIAGCAAKWSNSLLQCPPGNIGSGNGLYACSACATGWHVCGWKADNPQTQLEACTSATGVDAEEVARHTCLDDCRSQPGFFASVAPFANFRGLGCSISGQASVPAPETSPGPAAGSPLPQPASISTTFTAGCGTATGRYQPDEAYGNDCTGFSELAGKSCSSGQPGGIFSNSLCPATTLRGCDANEDLGTDGNWRGVLCCRDTIERSDLGKCVMVGVPEKRDANGDVVNE